MLGWPFLYSFWGLILLDRTHRQRVVADQGFVGQSHIGLRSATLLILQRVFLQKAIERIMATIEGFDGVMELKFFDASCQRLTGEPEVGAASKKPGAVSRWCIRGRGRVGASSAAKN